jgi:hypothetical protein
MHGELSLAAGQWAGGSSSPLLDIKTKAAKPHYYLASPDGAADPPCRPAPTPWRSALTGSCRRGGDLLMANVFCGRGINRVLGNVGGVISDALEMPRNEH